MLFRTSSEEGHPFWTYACYAVGVLLFIVAFSPTRTGAGSLMYVLVTSNLVLRPKRPKTANRAPRQLAP